MAVGDVYRLTVTTTQLGSTYQNTYALYQKSVSVAPADFATIANAIRELYRVSQSNSLTYRSWRAVQIRGAGVTPVQSECRREGGVVFEAAYTGTNTGGDNSTEVLPPQNAMVVTVQSSSFGRRHRGRTYVPGFSEAQQNSGSFGSGVLATITTNLTGFLALYGATGTDTTWQLGVWSERTALGCEVTGSPPHLVNIDTPHPELAFTPAAGLTARSTVFNQRRRTLGVGR